MSSGSASGGHIRALLGASGALLGGLLSCMEALWDRLGILLGRSRLPWAILEASWGALGSRKPEKARTRESLEKRMENQCFGALGAFVGVLLDPFWGVVGASWSTLSVYGVIFENDLQPFQGSIGPSWT